ncbi:MAG: hypothetical protein IJN54_03420, partial [Lachnospiraceae bacterium]|nr:hypothetical protein [Lachnospiraceae bacterium]
MLKILLSYTFKILLIPEPSCSTNPTSLNTRISSRFRGILLQLKKSCSAALFDGQTDEAEMGITYNELDRYIAGEILDEDKCRLIELLHRKSEH